MPTPLPHLPAVYYSALFGSYLGRRTGITLAWKAGSSAATAAADLQRCQDLGDAMTSSWNSTVRPLYPSDVIGWDARVYGLEFPTNPATLSHTTGSGAGGTQVAASPAAAVMRHAVLRRGRGSQSHTLFSPIPRSSVSDDGQTFLPGPALDWTTEFENFVAGVQTAVAGLPAAFTVSLVQLSKKGLGATYPITLSVMESLMGSARMRSARP